MVSVLTAEMSVLHLEGVFISGIAGLAILSLVAGFTKQAIALLVLRALLGISTYIFVLASRVLPNEVFFSQWPRLQFHRHSLY